MLRSFHSTVKPQNRPRTSTLAKVCETSLPTTPDPVVGLLINLCTLSWIRIQWKSPPSLPRKVPRHRVKNSLPCIPQSWQIRKVSTNRPPLSYSILPEAMATFSSLGSAMIFIGEQCSTNEALTDGCMEPHSKKEKIDAFVRASHRCLLYCFWRRCGKRKNVRTVNCGAQNGGAENIQFSRRVGRVGWLLSSSSSSSLSLNLAIADCRALVYAPPVLCRHIGLICV